MAISGGMTWIPRAVVATSAYAHQIGVGEADALVFAAAIQEIEVRFDMNALLQITTVREYEQVNGADYRLITARIFPTDFDVGCTAVVVAFKQANALYRITFQSALVEAGIISVPYRSIVRAL